MKYLVYLPLVAGALLLGWQLLPESTPPANAPALTSSKHQAPATALPPPTALTATHTATPPLPSSLRGTEVDGRLQVDADGNLLINDQLRHLFDYYLSANGEETPAQAQQRIRQQLNQQLDEPARAQALTIFEHYLGYLQAVAELEQAFPVLDDLDALWAREEAVQRLRASLFDPAVHQAFFAGEEVYNRFTLERLTINRNPDLDADQRAAAVEALRESLPAEMQELLVPQLHQDLRRETLALQEHNAAPQQIRDLRLNLVGPEATARLEALDQQRAEWQQRVSDFNRERDAILQQPGLAEQDKQAAIDALLQERFAANEQLRIASQSKR
ncbi:Lipase chaperone LimK [Halopseudomonas sabulinigri]|uniref:Lipase chaperone n=1 Tax=Halopseudomonas sabulinigri TaxID=472181 RepID=A0A1H1STG9_9GAMM|nr:lipase secretion chaperone [Halopseudomonas sabulinigri]SDS51264.1 Lipase chaperone LimK [Halopseudomonas sabulinigri]